MLSIYLVPGYVVGTKDTDVNKTDKRPSPNRASMRQIVNKCKYQVGNKCFEEN